MSNTLAWKELFKKRRKSGGKSNKPGFSVMAIPFVFSLYLIFGFIQFDLMANLDKNTGKDSASQNIRKRHPGINISALLNWQQFSQNLRDTVYTDRDLHLEVRVDQQMLYVHYRDGRIKEYPISTGIKGAHKSIDSRPGLFAIFMKEELHLSSQFNEAKMFYFMPYNMGIGFHGLAGTGYYSHLAVRPSSHGCVRMRTPDARELFKECDIGTLVLCHFGHSARVIGFAPEGFVNEREFTKQDYMEMLAYNLNSIYEGKYLLKPPVRFIIDPSVIPANGFNIGTSENIPEAQQIPFLVNYHEPEKDRFGPGNFTNPVYGGLDSELAGNFDFNYEGASSSGTGLYVDAEMINRLVFNKAGILPYFPPEEKNILPYSPEEEDETLPQSPPDEQEIN